MQHTLMLLTEMRFFCIKVSDTECLFHTVDGMWATLGENPSLLVVPLEVTITINGYRKFY